ncbi:acyltransferase family protein [Caulobacter soli]|uniref:acyltransferase family protein n=1 Tax=Caulobacter soli TaxID=2708539 RepID=UPI0013EA5649|nr:acyltransferase [Caulobacter soli]
MSRTATMSQAGLSRGGALDLLRFVAALFIVLYHVAERAPVSLFAIHPAFGRGYLATDFFLMLSGYVLAKTYGPRVLGPKDQGGGVSTAEFLKRRLLRIWPAHLVMLALFVAFVLVTGAIGLAPQNPQWFQWSQLPPQVFLVQAWFVPGASGWNMPTWTLSALIVCYAGFPAAWRATARIASPWTTLAIGVALFLAVDHAAKVVTGIPAHQLPLRFGLVRGIPLFVLGMLIARLPTTIAPRLADGLAILAGVGVLALQVAGRFDHASLALLGLLIYAAGASGAKGWGWAGLAGRLSFSLFLSNQLVAVVWFGLLRAVESKLGVQGPMLWVAWALALPACVAAAWLFERFVDAPLQVWIRGWSRKDTAAKTEPALA